MKNQDITALAATGQVVGRSLSRKECLELIIAAYEREGDRVFPVFRRIEDLTDETLRAIETTGTILEPAVRALNEAGITTPATIGGLMDAAHLTRSEIHIFACSCHFPDEGLDGNIAAMIVRNRTLHGCGS